MAVFYMKCNTGLKCFKELETVTQRCSLKMVFFKISQNLQEKTDLQETLAQVFPCEFRKNFKNTSFYRTSPVAAFEESIFKKISTWLFPNYFTKWEKPSSPKP